MGVYVCVFFYINNTAKGNTSIFFQIWKFACREARRVRGYALAPEKIFEMVQLGAFWCIFGSDFVFKVLEKCTKNLIGHSRLAFNNHKSNIDC